MESQDGVTVPAGVSLHLKGLSRRFGERTVLHHIDLAVPAGQFVAVVGRSGCGKSSLLRLLAGLDQADGGRLSVGGDTPFQRLRDDVRIMFQEARLLPWKRVADNVTLGLPGSRAERRAAAFEALAQVGLADRADDWPGQLSGGQRQRVALARALIHQPRVLLLDEPLGALDALTRIEMQALIEKLWLARGFTAVLVTHDVAEAVALADRILLIEEGRIALDREVDLPRARHRGAAGFAAHEAALLDRLLQGQGPAVPLAAGAQLRQRHAA